jgi:hypothetical protein
VTDLSPTATETPWRVRFPWRGHGQAVGMKDIAQQIRVTDDSATEQTDESRAQETSAVPTARLLANPRRVRRN